MGKHYNSAFISKPILVFPKSYVDPAVLHVIQFFMLKYVITKKWDTGV